MGCGTCVAVCLAGGEKEVDVLNAELEMTRKLDDNPIELGAQTVERQCDREYLAELDDVVKDYDAILSMACGVGIQFLAERFPNLPVFPAVDTSGLAVNQGVGWYEERCRSCSSCVLGLTGGICPVTMCAKGLYNGPCGGTNLDQLRDKCRTTLCLVPDIRAPGKTGPAGLHPGDYFYGRGLAQPGAAHPDPAWI